MKMPKSQFETLLHSMDIIRCGALGRDNDANEVEIK